MTEQIFFDTDCLSSFLWAGSENLLVRLYKGQIALPAQVLNELRKVIQFRSKIDALIRNKYVLLCSIEVGTPEADLYMQLTTKPDPGYKIIGRGEASAISMTRFRNGILGSNNLRDILPYIKLFQLKYLTTSIILVQALNNKLINEGQGNVIWKDMVNRGIYLPTATFSDFLNRS
jgi:hypothetical protein